MLAAHYKFPAAIPLLGLYTGFAHRHVVVAAADILSAELVDFPLLTLIDRPTVPGIIQSLVH